MRYLKLNLAALALAMTSAAVLTGCNKGDNSNPVDNVRTATQDRDIQAKNFTSQCSEHVLQGLVSTVATAGQTPLIAQTVVYRFEGANVTRTTQVYTKSDCSDAPAITLTETGSFALNTDARTSEGAKQIDIDYRVLTMTVNNDDGAKAANAIGICGARDWASGQTRDVTSHASDATCYTVEVPRHQSNIYYLDTSTDTIYFGTQSPDASDPSKRPANLDRGDGYQAH